MVALISFKSLASGGSISNPIQSHNLIEALENKVWWGQMNWNNPESSKLFDSGGWGNYRGESLEEAKILKAGNVVIDGVPSTVQLLSKNNIKANSLYQINIYNDGYCSKLLNWTKGVIGSPARQIDLSYQIIGATMAVDKSYQWDIDNQTRATLHCAGLVPESSRERGQDSNVALLAITSIDNQDRIKPIIYLSCKIKPKDQVSDPKKVEETNLQFVVSESAKKIMNLKYEPIANDVFMSDNFISFNFFASKGRTIKTEINRVSGEYSGILQINDPSNRLLNKMHLVGRCEGVKRLEPKF